MKHIVAHELSDTLARRATDKAWESYSRQYAKYEPRAEWVDDSNARIQFTAKGITVAGVLELRPGEIGVDLDVPFLLRPFKNKAIAKVESEIQLWIAKANAGELD